MKWGCDKCPKWWSLRLNVHHLPVPLLCPSLFAHLCFTMKSRSHEANFMKWSTGLQTSPWVSCSSSLWASASVGRIFSWWRVKFNESLMHWLKVLELVWERQVSIVVELTLFTADFSLCSVYSLWLHQLGRSQHSACSPSSFLGPLLAELLN